MSNDFAKHCGQCNEMDLNQVPSLWRNKATELNIANSEELVKIPLICKGNVLIRTNKVFGLITMIEGDSVH